MQKDAQPKQSKPNEGYVKFNGKLVDAPAPDAKLLVNINKHRVEMIELGLIGMYQTGEYKGVGFGNISERHGDNFIVSGTATGHMKHLSPEYYVLVTEYSLEQNSLTCKGKVNASSESMTHAAIYEAADKMERPINGVIHVHNLNAWNALLGKVHTTADVPYGTPEMGREMLRLLEDPKVMGGGIIVMAGHKEGIICFGNTLEDAAKVIRKLVVPNMQ